MKLIAETVKDFRLTKESVGEGRRYYIEGIFLQSEVVNGNERRYPEPVMDAAVATYQAEYIDRNRALGELNHPDSPHVNYERACIKTVSLVKDGHNWVGKAMVLSGGFGPLIASLIDDDVQIGVSSRGLASVETVGGVEIVQDDFVICAAADVVSEPSAPHAFVRGILERKEWVVQNGLIVERTMDAVEKHVKKAQGKGLVEAYARAAKALVDAIQMPR